jgi:hypothetical protein
MRTKIGGLLLLLLTFGVAQTNADSVYEISGTMTVSGNSSNPGVQETVNFSFELDYSQLNQDLEPAIVGTPMVTSFGPLGTFSIASIPSTQGYVGFFSPLPVTPGGYPAEIDLLGDFSPAFNPVPVISGQAWLYPCTAEPTGPCAPFFIGGLNIYGTATATVHLVSAPEPGTLGLCVLGGLALLLRKKLFTRSVGTAL